MAPIKQSNRLKRSLSRILRTSLAATALIMCVFLAGLIPVNNQFTQPDQGVELLVVSNAVHADLIMPRANEVVDWSRELAGVTFQGNTDTASHVAMGWGDKGFFLETPTWNDLKLSTTANALIWPSDTCVHVSFTKAEYFRDSASVIISQEQYARLVQFVKGTLIQDANGKPIQIAGQSYGATDAFLQSTGTYHILNTCNSWVGRGLKTAGVRTPWFSPLPKTPMMYMPHQREP